MSNATIFEYPILILERHLDTFGHVNNAVYLEMLEEARWDILVKTHFGLEEIKQKGIGPTILEIQIKFLKELLVRKEVIIKTQLTGVENKLFFLKQWIEDNAGVKYCEADFKMALFDLNLRKMAPISKEWLESLGKR